MSYSYLREKRFLHGTHGGYFTGVGAGSASFRSKRESYINTGEARYLFNESLEETSEEEWRKLYDTGVLIEKAVELLRQGFRNPKPVYEYSPDSPSPKPYEVPYGIVLLPNPSPPRDKEGKKIRDLGSEIPSHSTSSVLATKDDSHISRKLRTKDKEKTKMLSKSLQGLADIEESPLERPSLRSRIATQKSKEDSKSDSSDSKEYPKTHVKETDFLTGDTDENASSSLHREKSLPIRVRPTTLSSTRMDRLNFSVDDMYDSPKITRPLSISSAYSSERYKTRSERLKETDELFNDKPSSSPRVFRSESLFSEKGENKEKTSSLGVHDDDDEQSGIPRRPSFMRTLKIDELDSSLPETITYTNAELIKMARESRMETKGVKEETVDKNVRSNLEKTAKSNVKSNLEETDKSSVKSSLEKTAKSSSSHSREYNVEKLSPLKQRLEHMARISGSTDDDDGIHQVPTNTPLVQRAGQRASQSATQEKLSKTTDKNEKTDSLKSRFMKRFRMSSEERKEEKKDSKEKKRSRKRSESSQADAKEKEKEETVAESNKVRLEDVKPSSYDLYTTRGMRLSVDHRMASIDIDMDSIYKTSTSLADILAKEEAIEGVDMSKYLGYSPKQKRKTKDPGDVASTKYSTTNSDENKDVLESAKVERLNNDTSCSIRSKELRENRGAEKKKIDGNSPKSHRKTTKNVKEETKIDDNNIRHSRRTKSSKSEKETKKTVDYISSRKSHKKEREDKETTSAEKSHKTEKEKETDSTDTHPAKSPRRSRKNVKEEEAQKVKSDNRPVMSIRDKDKYSQYLKEPKSEFQKFDLPSPKGIHRRIHHDYPGLKRSDESTTSESEDPSNKAEQKQKTVCNEADYVKEEEIAPVVINAEQIELDFKSPRESICEVVTEEISAINVADAQLEDNLFDVFLQREVSEEGVNVLGTGEDEGSVVIDRVFEKLSQLSFDSYCSSLASSEVSLTDLMSGEYGSGEYDSTSSGADVSGGSATTDECSEHDGSRSTSPESMLAKIERANDELYSGVLNLTKSFEEPDDSETETVLYSSDDSCIEDNDDSHKTCRSSQKDIVVEQVLTSEYSYTSEGQDTGSNIINMNLGDDHDRNDTDLGDSSGCVKILEQPEVSCEMPFIDENAKLEKDEKGMSNVLVGLHTEEQLESNVAAATKCKEIDRTTGLGALELDIGLQASPLVSTSEDNKLLTISKVNASFDKAVEETTEDVNKMLHKCNSIDEINNDILQQSYNSSHSSEAEGNIVKNKSGSGSGSRPNMVELSRNILSDDAIYEISDTVQKKVTDKSLEKNVADKLSESDDVTDKSLNENPMDKSLEQTVVDKSVEKKMRGNEENRDQICTVDFSEERDTRSVLTGKDTTRVSSSSSSIATEDDERQDDISPSYRYSANASIDSTSADNEKSIAQAHSDPATDHDQMSTKEEEKKQREMASEIKSSGPVDPKQIEKEGIRYRSNESSEEETRSLNVDSNRKKSPASAKSLTDIQNRINAIKARRSKLLEVSKSPPTE